MDGVEFPEQFDFNPENLENDSSSNSLKKKASFPRLKPPAHIEEKLREREQEKKKGLIFLIPDLPKEEYIERLEKSLGETKRKRKPLEQASVEGNFDEDEYFSENESLLDNRFDNDYEEFDDLGVSKIEEEEAEVVDSHAIDDNVVERIIDDNTPLLLEKKERECECCSIL